MYVCSSQQQPRCIFSCFVYNASHFEVERVLYCIWFSNNRTDKQSAYISAIRNFAHSNTDRQGGYVKTEFWDKDRVLIRTA